MLVLFGMGFRSDDGGFIAWPTARRVRRSTSFDVSGDDVGGYVSFVEVVGYSVSELGAIDYVALRDVEGATNLGIFGGVPI